MNLDTAQQLLRNLLERASTTGEKTFLTSLEIAALGLVLTGTQPSQSSAQIHPPANSNPVIQPPDIAPDSIPADILMCVDFGTSFSKAFACLDTKEPIPQIIDLPIGEYGKSEKPLLTPSEMLIDEKVIYFGGVARKLFDDSEAAVDRLIDSIKQYMTLGTDVSNLARIRLDTSKDPDQKFFQRDILLLYLAHLMRLSERALEAKGISPNLRRRFAHPAWSDQSRVGNEAEMKTMMAQAIVLARSLGDDLLTGLSVTKARQALDELKTLKSELPYVLIAEPVREATAAGAGALLGIEEHKREAYIIVDVGAGTTDIAGCYCVNNPRWDRPRVFEVAGAASAIRSAGNVLDNALTAFVLQKMNLIQGSAEHRATAAYLSRNKRIYKERLFDSGRVIIELPTGEAIEVLMDEFLAYTPVAAFSKAIKTMVTKAAVTIAGDLRRIVFVATGGGARLPMVRKIAEEGVEEGGTRVAFTWREPIPTGLAATYPDLADPYPQIAVAVGGAMPQLPEQRTAIPSGLTDTPPSVMRPSYKS